MKVFFSEFRLYLSNKWIVSIPSHRFRLWFYRKVMKFSIGRQSYIFMDCSFDSKGKFSLGSNSIVNPGCRLDNRGGITIGNNVSVSQEVNIITGFHDFNTEGFLGYSAPVVIEDYAWIGTRAMILPGCTIGKGAVVAAGAVVTKSIEPFAVVAGVPAKTIKTRSRNLNYVLNYKRLFQ